MDKLFSTLQAQRIFLYRWFSGLFAREMNEITLNRYQTEMGQHLLAGLEHDRDLEPLVIALRQRIQPKANLKDVAMTLAVSYGSLFLGSGGHRSAPPYQSAYSGQTSRLYQESASQMDTFLEYLDMSPQLLATEPADHLAIQLSVLAHVCELGNLQQECAFLEDHLLAWLPAFADACGQCDKEGFYGLAAGVMLAWLQRQHGLIASLCQDTSSPKSAAR